MWRIVLVLIRNNHLEIGLLNSCRLAVTDSFFEPVLRPKLPTLATY